MKGWAYTHFNNLWRVYEVESAAKEWRMYGDREEHDYHDAMFYPAGHPDSPQLRTLSRGQLYKTAREAWMQARRNTERSVSSLRSNIKNYHEELKRRKRELADLDEQASTMVG